MREGTYPKVPMRRETVITTMPLDGMSLAKHQVEGSLDLPLGEPINAVQAKPLNIHQEVVLVHVLAVLGECLNQLRGGQQTALLIGAPSPCRPCR